jgi:hypothetical protein
MGFTISPFTFAEKANTGFKAGATFSIEVAHHGILCAAVREF